MIEATPAVTLSDRSKCKKAVQPGDAPLTTHCLLFAVSFFRRIEQAALKMIWLERVSV